MACRGVLFSIDQETVDRLCALVDDAARVDYITEVIEVDYFDRHREWLAQTDKAWDCMHRALTDGKLEWDNGSYPLNHQILGGELLYSGDDYIISLKTPQQVADVAAQLPTITEETFTKCFRRVPVSELNGTFDEDRDYTWGWFTEVRDFWLRAAAEGRFFIFTVDQ